MERRARASAPSPEPVLWSLRASSGAPEADDDAGFDDDFRPRAPYLAAFAGPEGDESEGGTVWTQSSSQRARVDARARELRSSRTRRRTG